MVRKLTRDERTLYVFALRYALPRHTYAFDLVSKEIKKHIKDFAAWELEEMAHDCDLYFPDDSLGGSTCDQPAVREFQKQLLTWAAAKRTEKEE